jgi:hypothetical protein
MGASAGKRIAAGTLPAAVTLAVLFAVGAAGARPAADSGHRAERLTEGIVRDLNRPFAAARHQLVRLSKLGSVRDRDAPRCNRALDRQRVPDRYTAFGAASRDGNVYCLSLPLTSPINIADRPYFLRAIGGRGFAVGDFQIGRATGADTLGLGYPTHGRGGWINGIVLATFALDWLNERVGTLRPPGALDVLVTDDHGTVLARAGVRDTPPGTNVAAEQIVRAMLARGTGSGRFHLGERRVATAFDVVPAAHGDVHVAVSLRR